MEEGDLSIDCNAPKEKFQYPSGKYEGLEIVFNMEILKQQPIVSLTDFGIGLEWYEYFQTGSTGIYGCSNI